MLQLSEAQRRVVIDKVPDMANVTAGAMVFGQFLADRPFSLMLAAAGISAWLTLAAWTLYLARRRRP
jgi:hypothetical protein